MPKRKNIHDINCVGELVPQKTRAGLLCRGWPVLAHISVKHDKGTHHLYRRHLCKCTSTGHQAHKDYAHPLITSAYKSRLTRSKEPSWQHQRMWKLLWMPTTTQGQHVEALPSHNTFLKTSGKWFIRQRSPVCLSPPLTNTLPTAIRQQHKQLSLVGDLHNLKGHCGHFNTM